MRFTWLSHEADLEAILLDGTYNPFCTKTRPLEKGVDAQAIGRSRAVLR